MLVTFRMGSAADASSHPPRYARTTSGCDCTSAGVPVVIGTAVQCHDPVRHGRNQAHVVLDHQHGDAEQVPDVLDPGTPCRRSPRH